MHPFVESLLPTHPFVFVPHGGQICLHPFVESLLATVARRTTLSARRVFRTVRNTSIKKRVSQLAEPPLKRQLRR